VTGDGRVDHRVDQVLQLRAKVWSLRAHGVTSSS
jgi:hypothetical protein